MKQQKYIIKHIAKTGFRNLLAVFFLFSLLSCQEEEAQIPTASTQAAFEYAIEFGVDPESGELNSTVTFTNLSINAASFLWDFGDGNTSIEENPVHVYNEIGIFDVTLTASPNPEQEGLHYNKLVAEETLGLVPTIFQETFDNPGLESDFPPEGWTSVDADGDGQGWYWDFFEEEFYILSRSWDADLGVLTPDNWIITPEIDLTEITGGVALEWEVAPTANTAQFRTENYSIMVSTTGTNPEDFENVFEERLAEDMENWVWIKRSVDMSEYAGENIHIAIRHHDSTDNDRIAFLSLHLFQSGK